jgi:hypothetical protein
MVKAQELMVMTTFQSVMEQTPQTTTELSIVECTHWSRRNRKMSQLLKSQKKRRAQERVVKQIFLLVMVQTLLITMEP